MPLIFTILEALQLPCVTQSTGAGGFGGSAGKLTKVNVAIRSPTVSRFKNAFVVAEKEYFLIMDVRKDTRDAPVQTSPFVSIDFLGCWGQCRPVTTALIGEVDRAWFGTGKRCSTGQFAPFVKRSGVDGSKQPVIRSAQLTFGVHRTVDPGVVNASCRGEVHEVFFGVENHVGDTKIFDLTYF